MFAFPHRPIPARAAGIGIKPQHYKQAIGDALGLDFFEVHAENFFGDGGPPHRWLTAFRNDFPITIHGVSLSIGGRDALDKEHLARLKRLVTRYQPAIVSEHLAWSADSGVYFNDLLAPPLSETALARVAGHVDETQDYLGRRILIENPSSYLPAAPGSMPEPEFLRRLVKQTGCGLLFDINNVYVSAVNLGIDAAGYVDTVSAEDVGEIHLAGCAAETFGGLDLRIDDHGSAVRREVWALYERFIARAGSRPTLIEWDTDAPSFETLAGEALKARAAMARAAEAVDAA